MTGNDEGRPGQAAPDNSFTLSSDSIARQHRPGDGYMIEAELRLGEVYRRLADVVCGDTTPTIGLCDTIGDLVDAAADDIGRAARLRGSRAALGALRKGRP